MHHQSWWKNDCGEQWLLDREMAAIPPPNILACQKFFLLSEHHRPKLPNVGQKISAILMGWFRDKIKTLSAVFLLSEICRCPSENCNFLPLPQLCDRQRRWHWSSDRLHGWAARRWTNNTLRDIGLMRRRERWHRRPPAAVLSSNMYAVPFVSGTNPSRWQIMTPQCISRHWNAGVCDVDGCFSRPYVGYWYALSSVCRLSVCNVLYCG